MSYNSPYQSVQKIGYILPLIVFLNLILFARVESEALAEVVSIPGTRVTIEPPEGFELALNFSGVQNQELSSSITILSLPESSDIVSLGMTKKSLLSRGIKLQSSEVVSVGGYEGRLFFAAQVVDGTTFEKWVAIFGNSNTTIWVIAIYPKTLSTELKEPIRVSVMSVKLNPNEKLETFEGLRFRIQETEHFKIKERILVFPQFCGHIRKGS